jgi:hypothetical protein
MMVTATSAAACHGGWSCGGVSPDLQLLCSAICYQVMVTKWSQAAVVYLRVDSIVVVCDGLTNTLFEGRNLLVNRVPLL